MIEFIGGIFSFAFGIIKMCLVLAGDLAEFLFGLLGGIISLIIALGGFFLAGALILVAFFRRRDYKRRRTQPSAKNETSTYDVDNEEFTSFYDQFRTQE